jgi:hypothetical protein
VNVKRSADASPNRPVAGTTVGWLFTNAAGALIQQQASQRSQIVENSAAGGEVGSELRQFIVDEPQPVALALTRAGVEVIGRIPYRFVDRLTEQLHVFVGTFDVVERCLSGTPPQHVRVHTGRYRKVRAVAQQNP